MNKLVIGIDPGAKGAVAVIDMQGIAFVYDAPVKTALGLWRLHNKNAQVFIEKQQAWSGQGVKSIFMTGKGYGMILGWLDALGYVNVTEVHPRTWQAAMLKGVEGDQKKKEKSMKLAAELFPGISLYGPKGGRLDGRADALCIAEYGKRS